jgi:hypothetical protein
VGCLSEALLSAHFSLLSHRLLSFLSVDLSTAFRSLFFIFYFSVPSRQSVTVGWLLIAH